MTINVGGKDYSGHAIDIINGRAHLVVSMDDVLAPVVNGVTYAEFEYRVVDGVATLSVPMGEPLGRQLPLSGLESFVEIDRRLDRETATQSLFSDALATADKIHSGLDRVLGMLDEHIADTPLAPVVDISLASGTHHARRSHKNAPSRTHFTPRPIN